MSVHTRIPSSVHAFVSVSEYRDGELAGLTLLRLYVKCICVIYTFDTKHGTSCQEQVWGMCVREMPNIYFLAPSNLHKHTQLFWLHFHSILGQVLPKPLSTPHPSLQMRRRQILAENPASPNVSFFLFINWFPWFCCTLVFQKRNLKLKCRYLVCWGKNT